MTTVKAKTIGFKNPNGTYAVVFEITWPDGTTEEVELTMGINSRASYEDMKRQVMGILRRHFVDRLDPMSDATVKSRFEGHEFEVGDNEW